MNYQSVNPPNGVLLRTFETHSDSHLDDAITAAAGCFKTWSETSFDERAAIVARAAAILRSRTEEFARHGS